MLSLATSVAKDRISSPLEAGPSLLDSKHLPRSLTEALDYVSIRLSRKRLHLSLIVVPRDIQLPQTQTSPQTAENPISTSPAKSLFKTSNFTRTPSLCSISDTSSSSSSSSSSSLSRTKWPSLPASPADRTANLPATPALPNTYGIALMHASSLTVKAERILRHTIAKAEKKFDIGSDWLHPVPLTQCPLITHLIHRSLTQNSILFSSEGLTLLALDHVYTFKYQLHGYSRSLSPCSLTLAVDELRRLVLAQSGRRITKGYLMRAYDWLGVSLAALVDVNEGYKVAYGGKERFGGIEVQDEGRKSPPPLKINWDGAQYQAPRKLRLTIGSDLSSSSARPISCAGSSCRSDGVAKALGSVDVGESAKGRDATLAVLTEDRGPHRRGPVTPNGFEDITPVTKGEWCFLMVGQGWKDAKTAPVETC
ncbi:hypothetical protein BUE80_DR002401 [Diplocarpon rosae]|nr:hypothetical protein BUE80_DR002401 [Diplocarpon rosae]